VVCWAINVVCWAINVVCWAINVVCWVLTKGHCNCPPCYDTRIAPETNAVCWAIDVERLVF